MNVTLLHNTPLHIADFAISKCWDKECDKDNVNQEKIARIANKFKHASTIEHVTYNFEVSGVSRALLQELARHRMANYSVKSTRYTLKELKEAESFDPTNENGRHTKEEIKRASKFIVVTGNPDVDGASIWALQALQRILLNGTSNDIAKYCLPESYKTELVWTINARSLQNFLALRSNKSALWEIRKLAITVFEALPEEHKFLFEHCMYGPKEK